MTATSPTNATADAGTPALSAVQKLAGLLLMLDTDTAARIMEQLEETDLEVVAAAMANFSSVSQEQQQEIMEEFSTLAVDAATSVGGGAEPVKQRLEKSVGLFRASDILCRVSPTRAAVGAMGRIAELDARRIYNLLRDEQVQTVALVASYLPPEKASQVLALVRPDQREQVVERLAMLAPTSLEVVEHVAEVLLSKLSSNRAQALNQTGGVKSAAQVLNALPKNVSDSILASLKQRNAELGDAVLKKMFTFEELERLDSRTLQRIMQEIDMRMLSVALKPVSESLKTKLLSSISKRAAESVREEISFMGPVKASQIEQAQTEIIEIVRRLESEEAIDLSDLRQSTRS